MGEIDLLVQTVGNLYNVCMICVLMHSGDSSACLNNTKKYILHDRSSLVKYKSLQKLYDNINNYNMPGELI